MSNETPLPLVMLRAVVSGGCDVTPPQRPLTPSGRN
ncbi:unnamed protein product [Plutella xylostella]|uniref:(diamondback moth) hypothetical protein n=1 Tax=Plutella xylostella TaxID=51655 RepID=A0A8S4DVS3_PLUXY|nr:unnamed protein product [Plutella xylostella]